MKTQPAKMFPIVENGRHVWVVFKDGKHKYAWPKDGKSSLEIAKEMIKNWA